MQNGQCSTHSKFNRGDYRDGHIPGAAYASLDRDLSDLSRQAKGLGRHPLPLEQAFSAVLSRWGWRPGLQVLCYDAAGGALAAARLWWLLRLAGVSDVAVLDGGFQAWQAAGLPLESGDVQRAATAVSLRYDAARFTTDHRAVVQRPAQLLVDARAAPRRAIAAKWSRLIAPVATCRGGQSSVLRESRCTGALQIA